MKKQKAEIREEVEKTVACFDQLDRIEANPFFYTRLEARLDEPRTLPVNLKGVLQSAWVFALILINIVSLIMLSSERVASSPPRAEYLQEIATDLTVDQSYIDPFEQTNN